MPLPRSSSSLFRFCTFYPLSLSLSLRFIPLLVAPSSLRLCLFPCSPLATTFLFSFLPRCIRFLYLSDLSLSWRVLLVFFKSACQPEKPKRWYPVICQCYRFVFVFRETVKLYEIQLHIEKDIFWPRWSIGLMLTCTGITEFHLLTLTLFGFRTRSCQLLRDRTWMKKDLSFIDEKINCILIATSLTHGNTKCLILKDDVL